MVVVLCEDYNEARNAYLAWLSFLHSSLSDLVATADRYSLRIETSDGLCYIFIDHRFEDIFLETVAQRVSIMDFFGLEDIDIPDPLTNEWRQIIRN